MKKIIFTMLLAIMSTSMIYAQFSRLHIKTPSASTIGITPVRQTSSSALVMMAARVRSPSLTLVQVKYAKNLKKKDVIVAAQTTLAGIDVNLYNKDNQLKSPEQFAGDLVHDLLHTLKIKSSL